MNWIRNIKFPFKLGAITVVSLVPVVLLGYFFYGNVSSQIATAELEVHGLHYYHGLEEMMLPIGCMKQDPELRLSATRRLRVALKRHAAMWRNKSPKLIRRPWILAVTPRMPRASGAM